MFWLPLDGHSAPEGRPAAGEGEAPACGEGTAQVPAVAAADRFRQGRAGDERGDLREPVTVGWPI